MIATYQFENDGLNAEVRVAGTPEKPLFVAGDVCAVLEIKNSRDALAALDGDERASVAIADTSSSSRNTITVQAVTESGLYHLIFKSRKPAAKVFRRWVTEEVLPTLRKTGVYRMGLPAIEAEETLTSPKWLAELGLDLVRDASVCQLLLERVDKAARQLRFNAASFREGDGFQKIPRPVLQLAEGFFRRDLSAPVNRNFFETVPSLAQREELPA